MPEFRPSPFYFINTTDPADLTKEACREAMRELYEAGFGGCVLFNKPPDGFDKDTYLGDLWFEAIENFILGGLEFGLEIWLNDGFNYPPGDAAGRIEARNPGLVQQRLKFDGKKVEVVDLPWGFPAFELPESSELFIEFVYEETYRRLGKYFGKGLHGFFSDCDNRRINAGAIKEIEGGDYYPWSKNFAEEFRKRCNYDITPRLAGVILEEDKEAMEDYWRVAGELYQQWFANNRAWCNAHGLRYTFHSSDTGPLPRHTCRRSSLFSEGDPLALLSCSDYPGTDHELSLLDGGSHYDYRYRLLKKCWGTPGVAGYGDFNSTIMDVRAKYAGSAAYMNNSEFAVCELFAATNYGFNFQDLKRIGMWQIMMGINFLIPHAVHHRFRGHVKYFAPPEFLHGSLRNGVREFNDMLTRACRITSRGRYCAAVAVIEPTSAIWRGEDQASDNLLSLCDRLNRSAVGYVVVSRDYIKNHREDFELVIDPADWDGKLELQNLTGGDVVFSGGELCFMRRRDEDGEFLIACNIWSDSEISGTLSWQGRNYTIALAPGEYAVFGGRDESFRAPLSGRNIITLPMMTEVEFSSHQRIPLEVPVSIDGDLRRFSWRNREKVEKLWLEIPEEFTGSIFCDGREISGGRLMMSFDDRYIRMELPEESFLAGEHELVVNGAFKYRVMGYLCGDVEASLWIDMPTEDVVGRFYGLVIMKPRRYAIDLLPRRKRLLTGMDIGKQGEVFYEGDTIWRWRFSLDKAASGIDLRGTGGVCDVSIDGAPAVRCVTEPFIVPVDIPAGEHELTIRLYGSLGALFQGGNAGVHLPRVIGIF